MGQIRMDYCDDGSASWLHLAHFAIMIVKRSHVWGPFNGTGTTAQVLSTFLTLGPSVSGRVLGTPVSPLTRNHWVWQLEPRVGCDVCLASAGQGNWTDWMDSEASSCLDGCRLLIHLFFLPLLSLRLRRRIVYMRHARELPRVYINSNAHLKLPHACTFVHLIDPVAS